MNILGGYLYKDPLCITMEMQQNYLSLCHNLLNSGIEQLSKTLIEEVF